MSDNRVGGWVGWCGGASERIHKTLTRRMRVSRIFFQRVRGISLLVAEGGRGLILRSEFGNFEFQDQPPPPPLPPPNIRACEGFKLNRFNTE